jgi:hypothetical protein
MPRTDLTAAQLVYRPHNIVPRGLENPSSNLYGMSPTEAVAEEIETGIARLIYIKNYYTEGTIPGAMLFAPVGTPPDKIKEAQQWLDSDLAGQLAKRRRVQILQGFQKDGGKEQLEFPKEPVLADVYDDYLIRKICFSYGVSPQRLQKMMNRSSADSSEEAAEQQGAAMWQKWLKGTIDYIIQSPLFFGLESYECGFDPTPELDYLKCSMADKIYVGSGIYTINEIRDANGDDPRIEPEADELMVLTATGFVPLDYIPPSGSTSTTSGSAKTPKSSNIRTPKGEGNGTATANKIMIAYLTDMVNQLEKGEEVLDGEYL